jgi:hypothetical protein
MGMRSLLDMRPILPRKGIILLYAWAVVGDEPESIEDIFLLRMPLEVVWEVDACWTETVLHVRPANWQQFSHPVSTQNYGSSHSAIRLTSTRTTHASPR